MLKALVCPQQGWEGQQEKSRKNSRRLWRSQRRKSRSVPEAGADFPAAIFLAGKCLNLGRDSILCWAAAEGGAKRIAWIWGGGENVLQSVLSKTTFGGHRNWGWSGRCLFLLREMTESHQKGGGAKRIVGGGSKNVFGEGFFAEFKVCFPPPWVFHPPRPLSDCAAGKSVKNFPAASKFVKKRLVQKSEGNFSEQSPGWILREIFRWIFLAFFLGKKKTGGKNPQTKSTAKFKSELGSFAAKIHTARIRPWNFAGKRFQQGISDSHSLLELPWAPETHWLI